MLTVSASFKLVCYSEIADTRREKRIGRGKRDEGSTVSLMCYVLKKERLEANVAKC